MVSIWKNARCLTLELELGGTYWENDRWTRMGIECRPCENKRSRDRAQREGQMSKKVYTIYTTPDNGWNGLDDDDFNRTQYMPKLLI